MVQFETTLLKSVKSVRAESKLPVAQVAGAVFVRWAACASTDAVDILIAL